jgi:hypothetical protein
MRYTLLLFALLATACVEPPSTAPVVSVVRPKPQVPGAPTGKLGGVIVTFSGVSSEVLQASAKPVSSGPGKQNLSAQDLSSASGLSFTNINQNSFTQGSRTNGSGFRYLTATFRVTPAIELQNLSFVAQVKAGSTLFDTAVLGLKKFDGSSYSATDAQTIARAVRPVHAPLPNGSSLLVNANNADFQVWSEAELGSYTPASGSYLLPYGFVARSATGGRALDGTAPGIVTFALKLPLQASGKDDPFSFSMYFEAVTDTQTRVTQSLEENDNGVGAAFRANQAGANTVVNLLPGVPYNQNTAIRTICNLRTAGSAGNPLARLFPDTLELTSRSPNPNSEHLPLNSSVTLGINPAPSSSGANVQTVQLISPWRGFLAATYRTVGSTVTVTPSSPLLPGEVVDVNAIQAPGWLCQPNTFRLRAQNTPSVPAFSSSRDSATALTSAGFVALSADFNRDGNLDLLLTNSIDAQVLLGVGDGNFTPLAAMSSINKMVTVGDFNGDGILDLASSTFRNLQILTGNGDGTFSNKVAYSDLFCNAVVSGDMNGDGLLDLILSVAEGGNSATRVEVWLGQGDATFALLDSYLTSAGVNLGPNLVLGDWNGDGVLDAAVGIGPTAGAKKVAVLLGIGKGRLAAPKDFTVNNDTATLVSGDFNNDGKLDLITGGITANILTVLIGRGDGSFAALSGVNYANQLVVHKQMQAGDFNGDGNLDLITGSAGDARGFNLLLGKGDGTFLSNTLVSLPIGFVYGIVGSDFNNDGRLDVALTSDPSGGIQTLSVLLNPSFANVLNFGNQSASVSMTPDASLSALKGDYTLEMWAKLPTTLSITDGKRYSLLNKQSSSTDPLPFRLFVQNGQLGGALCTADPDAPNCRETSVVSSLSQPLNDNAWHHFALKRQTGVGTQTLSLYVDGVSVATASDVFSFQDQVTNSAPLRLGADGLNPGFGGVLDEVRLWNVARTTAEISQNKNTQLSAPYPNTLKLYLKLDSSTGNSAINEITGDPNGTLSGFTGNPWEKR